MCFSSKGFHAICTSSYLCPMTLVQNELGKVGASGECAWHFGIGSCETIRRKHFKFGLDPILVANSCQVLPHALEVKI